VPDAAAAAGARATGAEHPPAYVHAARDSQRKCQAHVQPFGASQDHPRRDPPESSAEIPGEETDDPEVADHGGA
jgi:hypothetical protein